MVEFLPKAVSKKRQQKDTATLSVKKEKEEYEKGVEDYKKVILRAMMEISPYKEMSVSISEAILNQASAPLADELGVDEEEVLNAPTLEEVETFQKEQIKNQQKLETEAAEQLPLEKEELANVDEATQELLYQGMGGNIEDHYGNSDSEEDDSF